MEIRLANEHDFPEIIRTYQVARSFMKKTGNPTQWGDSWPPEALLHEDIRKKDLYVVVEQDNILGVFALIFGNDPTYEIIENGNWLNQNPYATIHRCASNGQKKGILKAMIDYALSRIPNVRIDTHHDNSVMRHLVAKYGFTECGIIYVEDGTPRDAFQLTAEDSSISI